MVDQRVRIMLVEDHRMLVDALAETLGAQDDIEVVATAGTLAEAMAVLETAHPDVVVMDVMLPDGDGAAAVADVLTRLPGTRVLILSAQTGLDVVARAVEAGAAGFVDKSTGLSDLAAAIRRVDSGGAAFAPDMMRRVTRHVRESQSRVGGDLTTRELQVLTLLTGAATVEQMAAALVLSPHTVRNHIRNVMAKLGAHSQLEAVVIAVRNELVALDGGGA